MRNLSLRCWADIRKSNLAYPQIFFTVQASIFLFTMPQPEKQRLSIPDWLLPGLDPEWVNLWETYGSQMVRADEVTIEEYRKNPGAHSFTYPTFEGLHLLPVGVLGSGSLNILIQRPTCLPCRGFTDPCYSTIREDYAQNI